VRRRIFGPKRCEVKGGLIKLHNDELHNLYSSPHIIKMIKSRMRWAVHVMHMGAMRNAFKIVGGNPEREISLGKTRRR
jgi:hypothetical protein